MPELIESGLCTGCMACEQKCKAGAIGIEQDSLGNLHPVIDKNRCVNCGACEQACPQLQPVPYYEAKKAYAVWSQNDETRKKSASGGAASEFYLYGIRHGYWICGTEYDQQYRVVHTVAKEQARIDRYRQSKYVYSEFREVYSQIRTHLEQGERVICISLPCKIAGLLKYLGRKYENLITVDIVCHGTPPYKNLWEHIQAVAGTHEKAKLIFREDNIFCFNMKEQNKTIVKKIGRTDAYLAAFLEGLNYRESCYRCSYARPERVSDITICDFWGLGQDLPFDHPYNGSISAVLIHTEEGNAFFEQVKPQLFVEERPVWEAIKGNTQLNMPSKPHEKRKEFEQLYQRVGFEDAVKICLKQEMKAEAKHVFRCKLKSRLRKLAGIVVKRYRG